MNTTSLPPPSFPEYSKTSVSKGGEIVKIVLRPALYTADQMHKYCADLAAELQHLGTMNAQRREQNTSLDAECGRLEAENARLRDALDDIAYRCDVDSLRAAIERARAALESKP